MLVPKLTKDLPLAHYNFLGELDPVGIVCVSIIETIENSECHYSALFRAASVVSSAVFARTMLSPS